MILSVHHLTSFLLLLFCLACFHRQTTLLLLVWILLTSTEIVVFLMLDFHSTAVAGLRADYKASFIFRFCSHLMKNSSRNLRTPSMSYLCHTTHKQTHNMQHTIYNKQLHIHIHTTHTTHTTHTHIYTYTYTQHTHTHIHTYTYTYTHTYTHTNIQNTNSQTHKHSHAYNTTHTKPRISRSWTPTSRPFPHVLLALMSLIYRRSTMARLWCTLS